MSESGTTTNKKWITERDGRPATVAATEEGGHAGILRVDSKDGKLSRFHKFVSR